MKYSHNTLLHCVVQMFLDIDECNSNPCLNNGTCIQAIDEYQCTCTSHFVGQRCEIGSMVFVSILLMTISSMSKLS